MLGPLSKRCLVPLGTIRYTHSSDYAYPIVLTTFRPFADYYMYIHRTSFDTVPWMFFDFDQKKNGTKNLLCSMFYLCSMWNSRFDYFIYFGSKTAQTKKKRTVCRTIVDQQCNINVVNTQYFIRLTRKTFYVIGQGKMSNFYVARRGHAGCIQDAKIGMSLLISLALPTMVGFSNYNYKRRRI